MKLSGIIIALLSVVSVAKAQIPDSSLASLKKYVSYLDHRKDAGISVAWWGLLPGAGSWYAGDEVSGTVMFAVESGLVTAALTTRRVQDKVRYWEFFGGARLLDLAFTLISVDQFNNNLRLRLGIDRFAGLRGRPGGAEVRLVLSVPLALK